MNDRTRQTLQQLEAHLGFVPIRFPRGSRLGSGGAGLADGQFAELLSVFGTSPPYVYVARQVTALGGGLFGTPYGIDLDGNLWNLAEIGANGVGVHSLPVGSVVVFWPTANGDYAFNTSYYRGTYV